MFAIRILTVVCKFDFKYNIPSNIGNNVMLLKYMNGTSGHTVLYELPPTSHHGPTVIQGLLLSQSSQLWDLLVLDQNFFNKNIPKGVVISQFHWGPYKSAQIAALPPLLQSAAIEEHRRRRGMAQGAAVEEVVYCGAAVETY